MSTMAKNGGHTLAEQIAGVETLVEAARVKMTRDGWEAKAILDLLAAPQSALRTLRWVEANRAIIVAAVGAPGVS